MGMHEPDEADWEDVEESDDWQGEWAQDRIADLEDRLADDAAAADQHNLSDSTELHKTDAALTWWENLLARLWWRWRWIVPLSALLIPFLILIGGLAVVAVFSGDDSGSSTGTAGLDMVPETPVQAEWPPGVAFAEHTIPAMIRDALLFAGAIHGYVFEGTMGDIWHIDVEPGADSTLDPLVRVYAPDGHGLAANDNRTPGDRSAAVVVILPQDGAYRVVIQAAGDGLTTGEYWLTVSEN